MPQSMRAMVLEGSGASLTFMNVDVPRPNEHGLLLEVLACGVCRTDLHVVDGELAEPALPLIPGHQIVGRVVSAGSQVDFHQWEGKLVGVPWLGGSCRTCSFCMHGQENLCQQAIYTGYQRNGGFAEFATADCRYCFPLPSEYEPVQLAPLLCAGLIGYRAWRKALAIEGPTGRIGFYGFGAAAHILMQVAMHQGKAVFAFTRLGDSAAAEFALSLGAEWAGDSTEPAPETLDAAIIFAPDGGLVPIALRAVRRGGRVVCAGIHMSDIPGFPYNDLWGERSVESVANLTRADGDAFLPLAASIPVHTETHLYALEDTNQALDDLRDGRFTGAAVIVPSRGDAGD